MATFLTGLYLQSVQSPIVREESKLRGTSGFECRWGLKMFSLELKLGNLVSQPEVFSYWSGSVSGLFWAVITVPREKCFNLSHETA